MAALRLGQRAGNFGCRRSQFYELVARLRSPPALLFDLHHPD
ncbi:MAG: hypothetical protein AAFY57_05520 [Cyanobacteria bacterium J06642_2]